MAKFRFDLESVLRARSIAEREKQRVVAEYERERLRLESRLRHFQSQILSGKTTLRSELVGPLNINELRSMAGVSLQAVRRAQDIVIQLAGVHRRLEGARVELTDAAKARRAIEILRDERFAVWKAALEKKDVAALDELAVINASRRNADRDGEHDDEQAA